MSVDVDVIVIGAGLAGLRALYGFRCEGHSTIVLEASDEIGGVWNFNRYPGARCDVESFDYSYRFSEELEQEWRWSERYATQPEILRYINHVADRFDLRRDVKLNTRVRQAQWEEALCAWRIDAEDGRRWIARRLVMAVGQLSTPKDTVYPGQDDYQGRVIYSARWPREPVDLDGKRVAIIGTGSSGVQMTPVIAEQAAHLAVFQRTANYSVPAANAPVSDEEDRAVKAAYRERREKARNSPSGLGFIPDPRSATEVDADERERAFEAAWNRLGFGFSLTYKDILLDEDANAIASEFVCRKIAEQVEDPRTRDKLLPKGFPFGTRRPSVDSGYFKTFNRDNVRLVDIRETPIERFTETGIETTAESMDFDVVIYATGFDVFTGSILKIDLVGTGGRTLSEAWAGGPASHLGIAVHGFPNLFFIGGPGSPSLLSNVIVSSEEQIDWLEALLTYARDHDLDRIEATKQAQADWVAHVNERARETLYLKTPSYYVGAEMPGKPQVFMPYSGGVRGYRRLLEKTAERGYDGFEMTGAGER
ncbi:cyclohexanone monooxygenase [Marinicauda pacifica]|uniref:NAD(P)/FAD-dependent oxidoreductase n=1 Tax=Marinicauda pacifica TaxID=1133559 RepID=A0A4V3RZ21_9PROT|nr:NAD(P)/FAD-dependent oxidoreductase [Marinicauda pacifica]TGY92409.1 NAD(P)/FAD-dependent oxidoreductase [Marinicauda pacifica]GGE48675.1 cyclohexanone monooxygenase [Marinicauda pacifica]